MKRSQTSAKLEDVRNVLRSHETNVVGLSGESKVHGVEASRIMSSEAAHYILIKGMDLESSSQDEASLSQGEASLSQDEVNLSQDEVSLSQDKASLSQDKASLIWDRGTGSGVDSAVVRSWATGGMGTGVSASETSGFAHNCHEVGSVSQIGTSLEVSADSQGGFVLEEEEEEGEKGVRESGGMSVREEKRLHGGGLDVLSTSVEAATADEVVGAERGRCNEGRHIVVKTAAEVSLASETSPVGGESPSCYVPRSEAPRDVRHWKRGSKTAAIAQATAALEKSRRGFSDVVEEDGEAGPSVRGSPPPSSPPPQTGRSEETVMDTPASLLESRLASNTGGPCSVTDTQSDSEGSVSSASTDASSPTHGIQPAIMPTQLAVSSSAAESLPAGVVLEGSQGSGHQQNSETGDSDMLCSTDLLYLSDSGVVISQTLDHKLPLVVRAVQDTRLDLQRQDLGKGTVEAETHTSSGMESGHAEEGSGQRGKEWSGGREVDALLSMDPSEAQSQLGEESSRLERERTQQARVAASVSNHMYREAQVSGWEGGWVESGWSADS